MSEPEGPLSQVVPVLVAALICDVAVADPSTGKKNLIGIFDRINVGTFPTQRQVTLYFKVADADGRYEVQVRFVRTGDGNLLGQADGELVASDRLASADFYILFPPLLIPEPGRYEFQIWANSIFLGSSFIDAFSRE